MKIKSPQPHHHKQPSISIDTDRNLDLDLRQIGSKSIDQPRSDQDSENRRSSKSPQRRPSFRSATPPQEADRPIRIRSTSPLPPPPYIRQAASTLTPPIAPNHDNISIVTHNIGGMIKTYRYCDALLWPTETSSLCCANGQVNYRNYTHLETVSKKKTSYAMTINKSQSHTLIKVGIFLPQSVSTQRQLYIAMSRVKSYYGLQFALARPSENSLTIKSYTKNVVFKSALI